jgi:hypothetical protein
MKPLPRAALTEEDSMIWLLVTYRFCRQNVVLKSPVVGFHRGVDDRDAELIFERQVHLKAKREIMRRFGWIAHPWIGLRLL